MLNRTLLYTSNRNGLYVQFLEHAMPTRNCIDVACAVLLEYEPPPGWRLEFTNVIPDPWQDDVFGEVTRGTAIPLIGQITPEPIPPLRSIQLLSFANGSGNNINLEAVSGVLPFYGQDEPAARMIVVRNAAVELDIVLNGHTRTQLGTVLTSLHVRTGREELFRFLAGENYTVTIEELTP